jgi:CheY-like chemotaxis protein
LGGNGGILDVSTSLIQLSEIEKGPPVVAHDLPEGEYFYLQVKDNGAGMEPWILERVFDPFFTTKKVGEGTGLGLSMVHGIIKEHGGNIQVQSTLGEGTQVQILLPLAEQEGGVKKKEDDSVVKGKGRIMVVDDEESLVEIQKEILENLGYEVTAMTSSTEALKAFKKSSKFDLLITDHTMPVMTGMKLSEEVLKIKPKLPIILCTGFSESVREEEALRQGIKKLIYKPLRRRDLAMTIFELLNP